MATLRKYLYTGLFGLALTNAWAEPIDLNSANAQSIAETIVGIGPQRAKAIVEFRESNGPFSSIDDLVLVKGIGAATLEKNRDNIKVITP